MLFAGGMYGRSHKLRNFAQSSKMLLLFALRLYSSSRILGRFAEPNIPVLLFAGGLYGWSRILGSFGAMNSANKNALRQSLPVRQGESLWRPSSLTHS